MRCELRQQSLGRILLGLVVFAVFSFSSSMAAAQQKSPDEVVNRYQQISGRTEFIAAEMQRLREENTARAKSAATSSQERIPIDFERDLPDALRVGVAYVRQKDYQDSVEAGVKYDWLLDATTQAGKAIQRAQQSPNQADRNYWLREAQSKMEQADKLSRMFLGPAPATAPASQPAAVGAPANAAATTPPKSAAGGAATEPVADRFSAGLLKLRTFEVGETQRRAEDANPQLIRQRAQAEFGQGRAGAGGVSLHSAVELELPAGTKIRRAEVIDGRLVLVTSQSKLRCPPLDMDHLAVAVRSIYDAPVRGRLTADEPNLIAVQTGKDQFGEVVWNKPLLPDPRPKVAVGEEGVWELGPAIGLLSDVAPSTNRVTYYGAIRGTRMGRVLLEADALLGMWVTGLDWRTGKPIRPLPVEGLTVGPERMARKMIAEADARTRGDRSAAQPPPSPADARRWWLGTTWYVWVPDRLTLRMSGDELEFADARMKLVTWSAEEGRINDVDRREVEVATRNYDDLARAYPVLKELVEVAKAVSVVRYLHREGIELDRQWERNHQPTAAETPATIRRYGYYLTFDATGRVLLESAKQEAKP